VLKKAMEPYLPQDVIYRPKSSFGAPLRRWMRHDLRELLGDLLSAESLTRRVLFEPVAVQLRAACSVRCVRRTASMRATPCCRCCASKSGAERFSTGAAVNPPPTPLY
jgi:asparagine synthetase B (glutamine-hydrolysing)